VAEAQLGIGEYRRVIDLGGKRDAQIAGQHHQRQLPAVERAGPGVQCMGRHERGDDRQAIHREEFGIEAKALQTL
jgi:hypothetical protein